MKQKENIIVIEYLIKTYVFLIVFSLFATIGCIIGFVNDIIKLFSGHQINFIELLIGTLVCFISSQIFFWLYQGRERIEITSDSFDFIRSNGIITIKKNIKIEKIESISTNPKTSLRFIYR